MTAKTGGAAEARGVTVCVTEGRDEAGVAGSPDGPPGQTCIVLSAGRPAWLQLTGMWQDKNDKTGAT